MEAQIKIHNASVKHLSWAVIILAGLLSGFFWLGYWTAEFKSASQSLRRPLIIQKSGPTDRVNPPTDDGVKPFEELDINLEDSVRL